MQAIHQYPLILLNTTIPGSEFENDLDSFKASLAEWKISGQDLLETMLSAHCMGRGVWLHDQSLISSRKISTYIAKKTGWENKENH